eukprot:619478-Amphidinium_carterae.1
MQLWKQVAVLVFSLRVSNEFSIKKQRSVVQVLQSHFNNISSATLLPRSNQGLLLCMNTGGTTEAATAKQEQVSSVYIPACYPLQSREDKAQFVA